MAIYTSTFSGYSLTGEDAEEYIRKGRATIRVDQEGKVITEE